MEYISKSAVVAELEKRIDELYSFLPDASKVENGIITISEACNTGKYTALESFRNYINTFEVKEVNFSKCYHEFLQREWFGNPRVRTFSEMMAFTAKHFLELGLKIQKGE